MDDMEPDTVDGREMNFFGLSFLLAGPGVFSINTHGCLLP
jgi:hypothetical protein